MKFVLFILAVLVLLWLLRGLARRTPPSPPPGTAAPTDAKEAEPMLVCAHCGVHIPKNEALPGRGGVFCGDSHRKAFEQSHPIP